MASVDFPENDVPEEEMTDAADTQPSLQDFSVEDIWDNARMSWAANLKALFDSTQYDNRIQNYNQKVIADAQAQAVFWQNIMERQLSLKLASQELKERQDTHALEMQRAYQSVDHQATLNNLDYSKARDLSVLELRTVEPKETLDTISETIADAAAKGAEIGARAMSDRTQTSAANISELSAARQVADTNIINTLAESMAVVQAYRTQLGEAVAALQALTANQPKAE